MATKTTRGKLAEKTAEVDATRTAALTDRKRIEELTKSAINDFYSIGRPTAASRVLCYSKPKVGKTWFLARMPGMFLLPIEDGADRYPVAQWKRPEDSVGSKIESLEEFFFAVSVLLHGKHDFKAVGIDTADALQELIKRDLEARLRSIATNPDDPRTFGALNEDYSEGYQQLADGWGRVLRAVDELRTKRGMHVFFTAHERMETVKSIGKEDFKRYAPALAGTASSNLFKAYFDYILFFQTAVTVVKETKNAAPRVVVGARRMHCTQKATHEAGCRGDILWPDSLPLDPDTGFATFWRTKELIETHGSKLVDVLTKRMEAAAARLPKERAEKGWEYFRAAAGERDYRAMEVIAGVAEENADEVERAAGKGLEPASTKGVENDGKSNGAESASVVHAEST